MPGPFEPLGTELWYDLGVGEPPFSADGVIRPEFLIPAINPLGACVRYPHVLEEK